MIYSRDTPFWSETLISSHLLLRRVGVLNLILISSHLLLRLDGVLNLIPSHLLLRLVGVWNLILISSHLLLRRVGVLNLIPSHLLLRLVGVLNLILISSHLFNIQGKELYLFLLLLLLQRSTAVQVRSSVRLMPQIQPFRRGLLPNPTTWSPDQHFVTMSADISRYIFGWTERHGLGFGQLVHTHREVSEMPILFRWTLRPQ